MAFLLFIYVISFGSIILQFSTESKKDCLMPFLFMPQRLSEYCFAFYINLCTVDTQKYYYQYIFFNIEIKLLI